MSDASSRDGLAPRSAIERWVFGPVPVQPMVLNRIILGGVFFLHACSRVPEYGLVYGSHSVAWSLSYREFVASIQAGNLVGRIPLDVVTALSQISPEPREIVLVTLYAALLASSLAFAVGLFTHFTIDLQPFVPVLQLLSYVVFLLKPAATILLWVPRTRTLCALLLLAMHVILEFTTNVGRWNYIMFGGLLTFLPPGWVARMLPVEIPRTRAAPERHRLVTPSP